VKLAISVFAALVLGASRLVSAAPSDAPSAASRPLASAASLTISVKGVSCASCTLSIRRALKKLDGVKKVDAGSAPNQAVIIYDPAALKPEQIVQTIDDLGFKATAIGVKG
jgi:copper chaperone CopZ